MLIKSTVHTGKQRKEKEYQRPPKCHPEYERTKGEELVASPVVIVMRTEGFVFANELRGELIGVEILPDR